MSTWAALKKATKRPSPSPTYSPCHSDPQVLDSHFRDPFNRFKYHSVLLQSALLLRSHHDLLGSHKSLLVPDLLQDNAGLIVQILVKAIFLNFLKSERSKEGIFLNDLPSIKVELRVDCPLGLVQDIEAEVVRLRYKKSTYSMGR